MTLIIKEKSFNKDKIEMNGNKYILGNGYMGYRGTLEEFTKEQLTGCMLSGIYDKVPGKWREPVNVPNGFFTRFICNGELLHVMSSQMDTHEQSIDIQNALHKRSTNFITEQSKVFKIEAERFLSAHNIHLMCMKTSFSCNEVCEVIFETGFDPNIWDINGPHLDRVKFSKIDGYLNFEAYTQELGIKVCSGEAISTNFDYSDNDNISGTCRIIKLKLDANRIYSFTKFVTIYTSKDCTEPKVEVNRDCKIAIEMGYDKLYGAHSEIWNKRWDLAEVKIAGDDEAQLALSYSIYQLLAIAPQHSDKVSIPARGLSGQVYKGAIFWDTEIFMLPFFNLTNPSIARNLLMYRFHTLDGARKKAREYGYRGAFYAWESQDTGDDACTLFNVTDVFTNRPMRTYFRDKQVHISADVPYAIWEYYITTRDESILLDGGAEVILECARFFYSYAYYKADKQQYEILDVTGPDEYHERVNNNAFTNLMVKNALEIAVGILELLEAKYAEDYNRLIVKLNYFEDISHINDMLEHLYIPEPNKETHVIEQFDGYNKLEDISIKELRSRMLNKHEYLGGGNGIATSTKILKQADTVLMLNLFKNRYSYEVKKANWEYYGHRTEHGSSLSACVYAMLASNIGNSEWGYDYFMKTATIDLSGESKEYVGTLYIGGTHSAANGGAWMAAIFGFAGISVDMNKITIKPALPSKWKGISFNLIYKSAKFEIEITNNKIKVNCISNIKQSYIIELPHKIINLEAGNTIEIVY